ncbi:MAG: type II toxin-antitoxin system HipA family toxin, partial [Lachnospiraceae bacterium]|nr:type II toxin-antitoxin system HipA family toxin [Lachnospiraceae bacterium]
PVLMGSLYVNVIKGGESYSFEYDKDWLRKTGLTLTLDPELMPYSGRQYPTGKNIFGLFADASPDRWGRVLMNKRERILAEKEGRKPSKLYDSDYLLGVYDETRMGGIRFKANQEGPFLSDDKETAAPPWATLRTLEEASRNFENDETGLTEKWLNQLIKPGSSLGGARPKATVVDTKDQLWIAKFPSKNDENDTGAWEMVAHDLAALCGLNVPEAKLEKFSPLGSTFLIKRFDRMGSKRVHFASAMTLLGKTDGASAADGSSYLDIAAFIKSYGAQPKKDLGELWKRIVFNMAVTNTDDHLRNHAFILTDKGWILSPLYDVNPVPYGDELSLNVDEEDNSISIDLAVQTAVRFGISESDAEAQAEEILKIVRDNWEKTAAGYG